MNNILEVKKLNVYYTDKGSLLKKKALKKHALKDVSFSMAEGGSLDLLVRAVVERHHLQRRFLACRRRWREKSYFIVRILRWYFRILIAL